jgi:hypothetical protein
LFGGFDSVLTYSFLRSFAGVTVVLLSVFALLFSRVGMFVFAADVGPPLFWFGSLVLSLFHEAFQPRLYLDRLLPVAVTFSV